MKYSPRVTLVLHVLIFSILSLMYAIEFYVVICQLRMFPSKFLYYKKGFEVFLVFDIGSGLCKGSSCVMCYLWKNLSDSRLISKTIKKLVSKAKFSRLSSLAASRPVEHLNTPVRWSRTTFLSF